MSVHATVWPAVYVQPQQGDGVEILKLHGSSNWLRCTNGACEKYQELRVSNLEFQPRPPGNLGSVEHEHSTCRSCGALLQPLVVPPTWGKALDHPILHDTWTRAVEVLAEAEAFTSIGYSLPTADAKVRDLLHLGFASGRLRQAMVVTGRDPVSAERWLQLFRQFWRDARLDIRQETFEEAAPESLFSSLAIPRIDEQKALLPSNKAPCFAPEVAERLEAAQKGVHWTSVVQRNREGRIAEHESNVRYMAVLSELGFDWVPDRLILPTHGTTIPQREAQDRE